MTQTEYREMVRLQEEIDSLRADNIVWSGQAIGFKKEADRLQLAVDWAIRFIEDHVSTKDADELRSMAKEG